MAEIRNVNIDKEFIVKFGVCRTNFSDDMLSITLEVLPEAIKEVLQETMVEDGEITVTPVKHGKWLNFYGNYTTAECDVCGECFEVTFEGESNKMLFDAFRQSYRYCPNCGAKMDGGENNGT